MGRAVSVAAFKLQREAKRDYRLWIGYQKREWIQLQYRKPNYLQEQDRLFQRQETLIHSIKTYEDTPVFLEQGQQIHLPKVAFSWIESLFLECCWLLISPSKMGMVDAIYV